MSLPKVRKALAQAFITGAFFDAAKVQWPNVKFEPPSSGPWAAFWFLPNQPSVAGLGAGGTDYVDGIVQVDLNYPIGAGEKDAEAKADDIRLAFKAGTRPIYDSQEVVVRSCGRSRGEQVEGFFKVIVTIEFYAHINR